MNIKLLLRYYSNGKSNDGFSAVLGVAQEFESLPFVRCLVSSQICSAALVQIAYNNRQICRVNKQKMKDAGSSGVESSQ